jgi:hypothetical protein
MGHSPSARQQSSQWSGGAATQGTTQWGAPALNSCYVTMSYGRDLRFLSTAPQTEITGTPELPNSELLEN